MHIKQRSDNVWEVFAKDNKVGKISKKRVTVTREYSIHKGNFKGQVLSSVKHSCDVLTGTLYGDNDYKCILCIGKVDLPRCLDEVSKDLVGFKKKGK